MFDRIFFQTFHANIKCMVDNHKSAYADSTTTEQISNRPMNFAFCQKVYLKFKMLLSIGDYVIVTIG